MPNPDDDFSRFSTKCKGLFEKKPVKVIALSSGKGGIGKSCIALNLAVSLAQKNQKVLLLDANLTLPCLDIMTRLNAQFNLTHVLQGKCSLTDTIIKGPSGIELIPGGTDVDFMSSLTTLDCAGLINSFNQLTQDWDYLIIDTAVSVHDCMLQFACSAQDIILVLGDDPSSIASTYSLIKQMSKKFYWQRFNILTNMIRDLKEAQNAFNKLNYLTDEFLTVQLNYLGAIPFDDSMHQAVRMQKPLVGTFHNTAATHALRRLANAIEQWPIRLEASDNTCFFVERIGVC